MGFFAFLRFTIKTRKFTIKPRRRRVEDAEEMPLPQPEQLIDYSRSKSDFSLSTTVIKRFCWEEIISLTANFSTVIDHGGFSTVYLAQSCQGAIKIHQNSERLNQNFRQEFNILVHLCHENIVQLLGYCDEQHQSSGHGGALVFEYIPSGNLQEKLHGKTATRMPWKSRMWIAFQLARAIQYLHHKCSLPIIHGDIKASNILLDHQLNCKLCDFGSAKMGFSATLLPSSSLSLMGSPGYIDPHYLRTGIASKKNDVYSFGVILLELITGMEAFCSQKEQLLTTIAAPLLPRRGQDKVVDLRPLMDAEEHLSHSEEEELMTLASISALCLTQQPTLRPSMADIVTTMTNKCSSIYSFLTTEKNHHHQP